MKVILVDDETLALDLLDFQINKLPNLEVIGKFNHLDIKKEFSLLEEADLVFLDIEMPEMNGIELAERILETHTNLSIVFVTAYNHYAVQAFELNALDYVLKPAQLERLKKTMERVILKDNHQNHPLEGKNNILYINIAGELTVELTKGNIEFIPWRTTKSQELFLYLLHHVDKTVRKSELVELLWPEFNQERAYSQLYTAIYHIRKTLKKYSDHFIIKNVGEGYNLSTKNVLIDLREWENRLNSAPPINIETIEYYEESMNLYKGGYLQEYDYLWTETERYRLELLWLKTAYQMAYYYEKQNNLEKAETWFKNICKIRPEDEEAHFSLMKLYATLELGLQVERQYIELQHALSELNLQIRPAIKIWFQHWKQNG